MRARYPDIVVATHTVPEILWGMHLLNYYTSALRYLAFAHGFLLVDLAMLTQGLEPRSYLRDRHHPDTPHCRLFACVMRNAFLAAG